MVGRVDGWSEPTGRSAAIVQEQTAKISRRGSREAEAAENYEFFSAASASLLSLRESLAESASGR
jgi:hypothetical protein